MGPRGSVLLSSMKNLTMEDQKEVSQSMFPMLKEPTAETKGEEFSTNNIGKFHKF